MTTEFVTKKELKAAPQGCLNCNWWRPVQDAHGRVLKKKYGKCAWPLPPMPFMFSSLCVKAQTDIYTPGCWWDSGKDCKVWTKKGEEGWPVKKGFDHA